MRKTSNWIYKDIQNKTFPNLEENRYPFQIRYCIFIEINSL